MSEHNAARPIPSSPPVVRRTDPAFRVLFERHPLPLLISHRRSGAILAANQAMADLLGYRVDELEEMHLADCLPEEDRPRLADALEATTENEIDRHAWGVWPQQRKDGRIVYGEVISQLLTFNGQPARLATKRDVTEQRQMETALGANVARLAALRDIDRAVLRADSLDAMVEAALERVYDEIDIPGVRVSVSLFDQDADEAVALASHPVDESSVEIGARVPLRWFGDLGKLRAAALTVIEDAATAGIEADMRKALASANVRSYVLAGLMARERLLGALIVASPQARTYTAAMLEMIREVANSIAVAIQSAQLLEQLKAGEEEMRQLSRRVLSAQEEERRRLAQELHDEMGQTLTAIELNLRAIDTTIDSPADQQRVKACREQVGRLLDQVRDLSLDLRPAMLDDVGLAAALRWYVDRLAERTGIETDLWLDMGTGSEAGERRLPDAIETTCFRVAQEAMTNVTRHADASFLRVALERTGAALVLTVQDDGCGFDLAGARARVSEGQSMGLLGMAERAQILDGTLEVETEPARGTTVRLILPLEQPCDG